MLHLSTIFAFLPMLFISGEMGLLMKLIPIIISCLIISSILESFLFLPLHSKQILKANEKQLDWTKLYNFYYHVLYRKTFSIVSSQKDVLPSEHLHFQIEQTSSTKRQHPSTMASWLLPVRWNWTLVQRKVLPRPSTTSLVVCHGVTAQNSM